MFYGLIEINEEKYLEKKNSTIHELAKSKPTFTMDPIKATFSPFTKRCVGQYSSLDNQSSPSESFSSSFGSSQLSLPSPVIPFRVTPVGMACYKANVPIEHCLYVSSYLQDACTSMCLADDLHAFFLATPLQNDIIPNYVKYLKIYNSLSSLRLGFIN
jgi:hypothetical protein